jgi:hypothetical protein
MTKKELILINFTEKVAAGNMFLEIGNKMFSGEDYKELLNTYSEIQQVQQLFDAESAKLDADLLLMRRCAIFIKMKLGMFLAIDAIRLSAYQIVTPYGSVVIIGVGGGSESGGGNGGSNSGGTFFLQLVRTDLTTDYSYRNSGLSGVPFTLDIRGGATLTRGVHYQILFGGGFQLIGGVELADDDFIRLYTVVALVSAPAPDDEDDELLSFPYHLPHLLI